jgi:hypothetical protein
VLPQLNLGRVPPASSIKTRRLKTQSNGDVRWRKILDVKIIYALAEDLSLVIRLNT